MAGTQASDAGRQLARARWGTRVLDRAVETVVERRDGLDARQLARLKAAITEEERDGGNG